MAIGRQLAFQVSHTLRRRLTFTDSPSGVFTVGTLPAGAIVTSVGVFVRTAFNAGTNNNIDLGVTGAPQGFGAATAMTSAGKKDVTLTTSASLFAINEVDVIATLALTGTAATAGEAVVIVHYTVNNDR